MVKNAPPLLQLEQLKGFIYADEKLTTGQAGTCALYVHLTSGATTFAVREKTSGKFLGAECILSQETSITAQLRQAQRESQLLSITKFNSCEAAVANAFHTMVPAGLFHRGDETDLLRFSISRTDLEPAVDEVTGLGIKVIYGIQPELKALLHQSFTDLKLKSAVACQLEYQLLNAARTKAPVMQLVCHPELLTIIVSEGKKLLFVNSFNIRDMGEATYYTLMAGEQLDLEISTLDIELNGTMHCCEILKTRLEAYCGEITYSEGLFKDELSYKLQSAQTSGLMPVLTLGL